MSSGLYYLSNATVLRFYPFNLDKGLGGDLTPEDVSVELYVGPVSPGDEIVDAKVFSLAFQETLDEGVYLYEAETVACEKSGLFGYTVRVLPNHPDLVTPFIPGLITWA